MFVSRFVTAIVRAGFEPAASAPKANMFGRYTTGLNGEVCNFSPPYSNRGNQSRLGWGEPRTSLRLSSARFNTAPPTSEEWRRRDSNPRRAAEWRPRYRTSPRPRWGLILKRDDPNFTFRRPLIGLGPERRPFSLFLERPYGSRDLNPSLPTILARNRGRTRLLPW